MLMVQVLLGFDFWKFRYVHSKKHEQWGFTAWLAKERGKSDRGDSNARLIVSKRGIFCYRFGNFWRSYVDE